MCRLRSEPTIAFLSSHDRTSTAYACSQVKDIPSEIKAGYWLVKSLKWLESLPFP